MLQPMFATFLMLVATCRSLAAELVAFGHFVAAHAVHILTLGVK